MYADGISIGTNLIDTMLLLLSLYHKIMCGKGKCDDIEKHFNYKEMSPLHFYCQTYVYIHMGNSISRVSLAFESITRLELEVSVAKNKFRIECEL